MEKQQSKTPLGRFCPVRNRKRTEKSQGLQTFANAEKSSTTGTKYSTHHGCLNQTGDHQISTKKGTSNELTN